ncbi:MAG: LemA family protein [Paludibacteraceae bacterium]|nr:LemA family protein [Paludibacteraceae bacterium]
MKKGGLIILVLAILAILVFWGIGGYNGLVSTQESLNKSWANVENQYQRRADLIPNLVETVKGYAKHESSTFEAVVNARSKATQMTIDPTNLTPEKLQEFQAAQGELSSALGRLLLLREAYPELKANQNFIELQAQLEGTENRIAVAREQFNQEVQSYNTTVRRFPKNIIAGLFGFERKPTFEAEKGAEQAPEVKF